MLVAVCLSELFVQWPDPLPPPEKMQRCSSTAPPQHPGTARDRMQHSHTLYVLIYDCSLFILDFDFLRPRNSYEIYLLISCFFNIFLN